MANQTLNISIKEWYTTQYPTDELGADLKPNVTFEDVFNALDRKEKDIYSSFFTNGQMDSLVRERVFEKLAEIMKVDYTYVYDQWLFGGENPHKQKTVIPWDATNQTTKILTLDIWMKEYKEKRQLAK